MMEFQCATRFAGRYLATVLLILIGALAIAAEGPPDGSTPEQKAAIADDPAFRGMSLVLEALTGSQRPARTLFNGRDLSGWDTWLGYANSAITYTGARESVIGLNRDRTGVFSVVTEDGRPVIRASGEIWGALITKRTYANYHLRLQYKWGPRTWTPMPRNNGVLYHSHGRRGAFFGTWMAAVELEMVPHSIGMLLCVGDSQGKDSFTEVDWKVGARTEVGHDPAIAYPSRRYMPGGRLINVAFPGYNVEASVDAERPVGEWNTIDLYVYRDTAVHVVNGVPVMVVRDITTTDGNRGKPRPLTSGFIQLQSEGAETFFRDITIEPIDRLPSVRTR